jgi:uncharacterized membrane protein YeaQ/YmgE (transglycosylase-associated protein family)
VTYTDFGGCLGSIVGVLVGGWLAWQLHPLVAPVGMFIGYFLFGLVGALIGAFLLGRAGGKQPADQDQKTQAPPEKTPDDSNDES